MALDDESTKQVAEENGTEWIKFWDSTQHENYYLNIVTNETRCAIASTHRIPLLLLLRS